MKPAPAACAALVLLGTLFTIPALGARQQAPGEPDARLAFLRNARIVSWRPIGKGVTGSLRLTLTDGATTHDASFQSIDQQARPVDMSRGLRMAGELRFVDSYRYNLAAWEIARLVGLDHMMPPTVRRTYRGRVGALSWWVDDVMMDEAERERLDAQPHDGLALARQRQRMQVFAELVRDTDRNKGNVLYTRTWDVVMLDFTRAFRLDTDTRLPANLTTCDGRLLASLRGLDAAAIKHVADRYLTGYEVNAVLARRDRIVAHFDALVAARGTAAVLY
ncbi:MAG: hypothetical protein R2712_02825 [Vicinamibacterales bacterium]